MISILILIGGLLAVLAGANALVEGAASLAKKMRVSDLVIGLTVVAFGTSAPELTVSVYSGMTGQADIALGNVVGSNIFNVLVILGLSALLTPLKVHSNTVWKEIPLGLLAALMLLVFANDVYLDGQPVSMVSRTDSMALLGFFVIFLYYTFDLVRRQPPDELEPAVHERSLWFSIVMVAVGLGLLIAGGKWTVDGAVSIALAAGISQSVVGLTIVAAGTSLPELATSLVAAYKKNADIAVGNIIGSNIFNIFFILGVAGVVTPLGLGDISNADLLFCVGSSLLLLLFSLNFTISRKEGAVFFLIYCLYTFLLVTGRL